MANTCEDGARPEYGRHQQVIDIEAHEAALLACQVCAECQRESLAQSLDPLQPVALERTVDELAGWRERASRHAQVERPRVVLGAGTPHEGGWYEVVGYDVEAAMPTIVLQPGWRPAGTEWVPDVHRGVEPGRVLEAE